MKKKLTNLSLLFIFTFLMNAFCSSCKKEVNEEEFKNFLGEWSSQSKAFKENYYLIKIDSTSHLDYHEHTSGPNESSFEGKARFTNKKITVGSNYLIQYFKIIEYPTPVSPEDSILIPPFGNKFATWKCRLQNSSWYSQADDYYYK